jgi:hypothetical protein
MIQGETFSDGTIDKNFPEVKYFERETFGTSSTKLFRCSTQMGFILYKG